MTKLLEKAFEVATKLPPEEQDAVAALVLDEIASEERWDKAFSQSQDVLAALAKQALEAHASGKSTPLNEDSDFKGH
ncbi:MAG: hypothetical protein WD851_23255 [Pirellulales bacterium]